MLGAPRAEQNLLSRISEEFTKAYRLSRREGYDHVFRNKCLSDSHFKVFYKHTENRNAKLGIVVSKKSLPKAVSRNRMKRVIRESFRKHGVRLCKLDVVVFPYSPMFQERQVHNLEMLFNRVENRCTKF